MRKVVTLVLLAFVVLPTSTAFAATVTFSQPTWGILDELGTVPNNVTQSSSTPIAYRGNDDGLTAVRFCQEFGYTLISFIIGNNDNPTVTWDDGNQQRWENDGSEPVYSQISCDNGLAESSVEVTIENIGDIIFMLSMISALMIAQLTVMVFGRQ